jgi:hypothetical protein
MPSGLRSKASSQIFATRFNDGSSYAVGEFIDISVGKSTVIVDYCGAARESFDDGAEAIHDRPGHICIR